MGVRFRLSNRMSDDEQVDLGFIYKMLDTRDPSKRRVKPADPQFLVIKKVANEDSDDDYIPDGSDEETEKSSKVKNEPVVPKPAKVLNKSGTKRKKAEVIKSSSIQTRSSKRKK